MASLLTQFAARGCEVPAVDPRIAAHVEALVVDTADETQAPPATDALKEVAPVLEQISTTFSASTRS